MARPDELRDLAAALRQTLTYEERLAEARQLLAAAHALRPGDPGYAEIRALLQELERNGQAIDAILADWRGTEA